MEATGDRGVEIEREIETETEEIEAEAETDVGTTWCSLRMRLVEELRRRLAEVRNLRLCGLAGVGLADLGRVGLLLLLLGRRQKYKSKGEMQYSTSILQHYTHNHRKIVPRQTNTCLGSYLRQQLTKKHK